MATILQGDPPRGIKEPKWTIGDAASAVEEYRDELMEIVNEQAEDYGLWFQPKYITEDKLQRALRRLHVAIEGKTEGECAEEAIKKIKG